MALIHGFLLMLLWRLLTTPPICHFGAESDNAMSRRLLRYGGPMHLLTMAPTRSGKGVSTLLSNLLTLDRSIVCIDRKREDARIASNARSRFGPVYVLDPFGISGSVSWAFNTLASLDPSSLADALVFDAPGEAGEAHWNEEAKALIGGLLLFIAAEEPAQRPQQRKDALQPVGPGNRRVRDPKPVLTFGRHHVGRPHLTARRAAVSSRAEAGHCSKAALLRRTRIPGTVRFGPSKPLRR